MRGQKSKDEWRTQIHEKPPIFVAINDLGVDTCNIRHGVWEGDDADTDFVENVKGGIINPLIVRPTAEKTGKKYAIVAGSRRFHAAVLAGLLEVPCVVVEMDDFDALALSVLENEYKRPPTWRVVLQVRRMLAKLKEKGVTKLAEQVQLIASYIGKSREDTHNYVAATALPDRVLELMKPESERFPASKLFTEYGIERKNLDILKAATLGRAVRDNSIPKEVDLVAVAAELTRVNQKDAKEFLNVVITHPKMPMSDAYAELYDISQDIRINLTLPESLRLPLQTAASTRKKKVPDLVAYYMQEGLRRDGYL